MLPPSASPFLLPNRFFPSTCCLGCTGPSRTNTPTPGPSHRVLRITWPSLSLGFCVGSALGGIPAGFPPGHSSRLLGFLAATTLILFQGHSYPPAHLRLRGGTSFLELLVSESFPILDWPPQPCPHRGNLPPYLILLELSLLPNSCGDYCPVLISRGRSRLV